MVARRDRFHLPAQLAEQIISHAVAGYPEEVCGLVSGKDGVAMVVHPGRNVAAAPRTTFELDPETLTKQIDFEEAGLELVAIYHSHPHGPAFPSETDVERAAYPDAFYLICDLADPDHPTLHVFRYDNRCARFAPTWDNAYLTFVTPSDTIFSEG